MKKELPKIDLKKLSANPVVFAVLISIVCIALLVVCIYTANQTKTTQAAIETSVQEFNTNKKSIEKLLDRKEKSDLYTQQNAKYEALITSGGFDQQQFMIDFDKISNDYNCRLTLITFGDQGSASGVKTQPIEITVTGSYNDLIALCDGIISQDRFYRIDGIKITSQGGASAQNSTSSGTKSAVIDIVAFSK